MITNLDMDCLRTFVTIVDLGSFAEAAQRIGRTASAVSLQINRLEEQVGVKLFQKMGRRMMPSPEGERLLSTARQVLDLNDQVVEALAHQTLSGEISLGAIQDFADSVLPSVLAKYRQSHPNVRITARVDRSQKLVEAVESGQLDLAIGVDGLSGTSVRTVRRDRVEWLGHEDFELSAGEPVPLVMFEPPCIFREAAINALNRAGREWQVVFTSPSLSGLRAAVEARLGLTVRTYNSFQGQLRPLPSSAKLPDLPAIEFALYAKPDLNDSGQRLCEIFIEQLSEKNFG